MRSQNPLPLQEYIALICYARGKAGLQQVVEAAAGFDEGGFFHHSPIRIQKRPVPKAREILFIAEAPEQDHVCFCSD